MDITKRKISFYFTLKGLLNECMFEMMFFFFYVHFKLKVIGIWIYIYIIHHWCMKGINPVASIPAILTGYLYLVLLEEISACLVSFLDSLVSHQLGDTKFS